MKDAVLVLFYYRCYNRFSVAVKQRSKTACISVCNKKVVHTCFFVNINNRSTQILRINFLKSFFFCHSYSPQLAE